MQESTREKVYSFITITHKMYGEEAAEELATKLIEIVDSSETEAGLLETLNQMKQKPIEELLSPISEKMTFEEYKQKVKECLMSPGTAASAEERMKLYEDELPQFYKDNWTPGTVAAALIMGA